MGKENCQSEVKLFLEKLSSWREETNRQFLDIVYLHTCNIYKRIEELVGEVSDLQSKLSTITKERNDLLENVNKLNCENIQLKLDCEIRDQEQHLYKKDVNDSTSDQRDNNLRLSNGSTYNEFTKSDDIEIKHEPLYYGENVALDHANSVQEENEIGNDQNLHNLEEALHHICPKCCWPFPTREALNIHIQFIHTMKKLSETLQEDNQGSKDISGHVVVHESKISEGLKLKRFEWMERAKDSRREEKVKCQQCPYTTTRKSRMNEHVRIVHENNQDHQCIECGYATSVKSNLKRHIYSIHKMGEKEFKCKSPRTSPHQSNA